MNVSLRPRSALFGCSLTKASHTDSEHAKKGTTRHACVNNRRLRILAVSVTSRDACSPGFKLLHTHRTARDFTSFALRDMALKDSPPSAELAEELEEESAIKIVRPDQLNPNLFIWLLQRLISRRQPPRDFCHRALPDIELRRILKKSSNVAVRKTSVPAAPMLSFDSSPFLIPPARTYAAPELRPGSWSRKGGFAVKPELAACREGRT